MISFLLLIFLLQLAIYLVNAIGASTIDNLVRRPLRKRATVLLKSESNHSYGSFTYDYRLPSPGMPESIAN